MINTRVLILFIRNPELGKVKTRLARNLGDAEALRIYKFLLDKTRAASMEVSAKRHLFYSNFIDEQDLWPNEHFHKRLQATGDLGKRMEAAFEQVFQEGAEKVIIIGSDCPELNGAILEQAFAALEQHDFVLGPTPDGGYYLLGMNHFEPSVFREIEWSTETVREKTLKRIHDLDKSVFLLPELNDIDVAEDWEGYLSDIAISEKRNTN